MGLPSVYEPDKYEHKVYTLWEEDGAFTPKNRGGEGHYSIVVPPPNANGDLHLGHGLTLALEDIAVRYHRMKGKAALLLPGADHAGFETQVVYEKQLAKEGKSRFDFTREELYKQIWNFVAQNKDNYESQFRRLGASVDWTRYTYTLDQNIVDRAYVTFKKMWEEDLIYRGERLVNFCTYHGTGFADIEVSYKEVKGHLWHITYPLTDGSGEITVATTRPETMLGDTAVAVHPDDKRYKKYVGKTIKLPLTNREVPILADAMVEKEFGTGAVKITPAHDPNDYELAERHDLPMLTVIGPDGNMTHEAGEAYQNLDVKEARKKVVSDLEKQGYLVKTEDYTHSVGHCYKCGTVIEPLLREQWFIDMQPLAKRAIKVLNDKEITFYPTNKCDQLVRYLEGLKDWNISRQIAWGIPIPAFQNVDDPSDWIFNTNVDQEFIKRDGKTYHRDPDVFDTWFSSSSWPYATLNYPDADDFKNLYPLSLMETAADILYPWVSRMIMFGLYVTDQPPFEAVYLHGLIQDEHGAKMSKSKGNVVDPMSKIDAYGSDAFRMGIIADESAGTNRPYDESKLVGARNFCNKLWNIARYIESKEEKSTTLKPSPETIADHWVLSVLQHRAEKMGKHLEEYRFAEGYELLYHTVWDDVADWYVEASKSGAGDGMLAYVLQTVLKLAHPFAPFVTEAIWQHLGWFEGELLITSSWPEVKKADKTKAKHFEEVKNLVSEIRQLKTVLKLTKPELTYTTSSLLDENRDLITQLAKLGDISQNKHSEGVRLISAQAWLQITDKQLADYNAELKEKVAEQKSAIAALNKRLSNTSYVENAPKHIVEDTVKQRDQAEADLALLEAELTRFS